MVCRSYGATSPGRRQMASQSIDDPARCRIKRWRHAIRQPLHVLSICGATKHISVVVWLRRSLRHLSTQHAAPSHDTHLQCRLTAHLAHYRGRRVRLHVNALPPPPSNTWLTCRMLHGEMDPAVSFPMHIQRQLMRRQVNNQPKKQRRHTKLCSEEVRNRCVLYPQSIVALLGPNQ